MTAVSYEKMDPITHIHKRPDMYLGTLDPKPHDPEWVLEDGQMRLLTEPVYSDGLWRIFLEPVSNVIDNVWRSRQAGVECKKIRVDIDPETAEVVIWNDGQHIPIEVNKQTGVHNPELIFGNLLTSSNYNDDEERLSSGRNGLGVKLTNVFSNHFHVECGDPVAGVVYTQHWEDHMRKVSPPKIRKKKTTGYTCVRFTPDLALFKMTALDATIMGLFRKTCADMSMATNVPVLLNKEKLHVRSLKDYAALFPQPGGDGTTKQFVHWDNTAIQKRPGEELEVVVCPSFDDEYHEVAFVNGIYNKEGGVHADAASSEFFRAVLQRVNKNRTEHAFTVKDLRPYFTVFVRASLINPTFSNQNKTRLQSPSPKAQVDPKVAQHVCAKWGFMEKMNDLMRARELISLKKTERKRGYKRIEGLDHANKSGTKESLDCTLILCEGLSAKTYAVKGIQKGWNGKKGRDYFAVYPLRGKVMNARNASTGSISQNKEISSIIQALNLRHKVDYAKDENFATLSYGRVMIITDADVDGLHIASLIINVFHVLFPSLLARPDFLFWMMTPVAKIFPQAGSALTFYNDFEYQKALESAAGGKFRVKYYKGLGSSNDDEIRDTFGVKVVSFYTDKDTGKNLEMVFSKSHADDRKKWMGGHDPKAYDTPGDSYAISKFVNQEHVRFSIDDCKRSIPSLFDGLKLSQRKIMYTVFRRNLGFSGKSMKVAQLAGSVAELSCYHHGEQNLLSTIINLAQDYVGSLNNVPLLFPDGQFGTKLQMGRDAANGRYIHTKMMRWTRILFPEEDDDLLTYTLDDGQKVEPDYYVPILPLILVNGVRCAIGSGWSCSIPSHDPIAIVDAIRGWLREKDAFRFPDLAPHYNGFTGTVEKISRSKYKCNGVMTLNDAASNKRGGKQETHRVTEVPVDCSIDRYKEFLEGLLEEKKIKGFKNFSSPDRADFCFTPADNFRPTLQNMNLTSDIHLTNIVLFDDKGIRKRETLNEIFGVFCRERLALYQKRKDKLIHALGQQTEQEETRLRFIEDVMRDKIVVFKKTSEQVEQQLRQLSYPEASFPSLLSVPIRSFTKENVAALRKKTEDMRARLAELRRTTPEDMWSRELDDFITAYTAS